MSCVFLKFSENYDTGIAPIFKNCTRKLNVLKTAFTKFCARTLKIAIFLHYFQNGKIAGGSKNQNRKIQGFTLSGPCTVDIYKVPLSFSYSITPLKPLSKIMLFIPQSYLMKNLNTQLNQCVR